MNILSCAAFLLLLFVCLSRACLYNKEESSPVTHWHYGQGASGVTPYYWWKVNENCGHGSHEDAQSPVDITHTEFNSQMKSLKLSYPDEVTGIASNNGHTVNFLADDFTTHVLRDGPLGNGEYAFYGFHIHWGESEVGNQSLGSEHSIDGLKQSAEIHFVHANTKYNISDISNHADGIAVIGVLLEVDNDGNDNYDQIFDISAQLPLPSSDPIAFEIDVESLLPNNLEYYHYSGSLTAPGCNSAVKWIVLRDSVKITPQQLSVLFSLSFEEEEENGESLILPIGPNNRPIQSVNDRVIYRNFNVAEDNYDNSSSGFLSPLLVFVVAFLSMFI